MRCLETNLNCLFGDIFIHFGCSTLDHSVEESLCETRQIREKLFPEDLNNCWHFTLIIGFPNFLCFGYRAGTEYYSESKPNILFIKLLTALLS